MIRKGKGPGISLVRGFVFQGAEKNTPGLAGIKIKMVFSREFGDVFLAGPGIGLVHPDIVKIFIQNDQGGDGMLIKGLQQPGLLPQLFLGPFISGGVIADAQDLADASLMVTNGFVGPSDPH